MKASVQWLRSLVPGLKAPADEIAARFTAAGLEVEAIHAYGEASKSCVVARVVSMRAHPSRGSLNLVTVDRGGSQLEVVCGAPNVPAAGGLVVLAPLGTVLPAKGMTIERRAIGGIESTGMLCSEVELGLTDAGEGILVLPPGTAEPGTTLAAAVPESSDAVLEIGLTPNRPDGLGHIGLARELAALYGLPFAMPKPDAPARVADEKIDALVHVSVEDGERCPEYAAGAVVGVLVAPSPLWLRYRLAALGVRSISNAVDVTNLVLLEYGHPMHAFDLDRVGKAGDVARIVVRRARAEEKLTTLDGAEHALDPDDLVIAEGGGEPLALAGVMGGKTSEIKGETRRVLLECAYFEPRGVRRASRRHALHTDSSHRFERGVDAGDTLLALARATSLLTTLAGGSAVPGVVDCVKKSAEKGKVALRSQRMNQLLGVPVPWEEALAILGRLGFEVVSKSDGSAEFAVPLHRPDVSREVDLIEEVARVRGMDAIPTTLPRVRPTRDEGPRERHARAMRRAAVELGLSEAVTYGFASRASLESVGAPAPSVVLENPLSVEHEVMRTSLLPGLLEVVSHARRHGVPDVRLFTTGAVFLGEEEPLLFAAVLAGERLPYLGKPEPVDVWDAKGLAEGLVLRVLPKAEVHVRQVGDKGRPHLHPRGAAELLVQGRPVGALGTLHPDVAGRFELAPPVAIVEIDLQALFAVETASRRYAPIPRFPANSRDLAVLVLERVPAGEVLGAVRSAAGSLATDVTLFDRFKGQGVPEGHQSLAFHVLYRAEDRTLTDAEVDAQHAKVVAEVQARFGATLRA